MDEKDKSEPMKPVRVLLAEDHTLVRAGIRSLLEKMEGVTVVGEAQDGRDALAQIEELKPDIVLMDISMPLLNGLETTRRCTKDMPMTRVVILSMYAAEEYVVQALRAGAAGYMLKDSATSELELALHAVARGEIYLSPAISRGIVEDYLQKKTTPDSPLDQLTTRQREILQLIAEGKSSKEIAYILDLNVKTIETHRAQLMKRLNIRDLAGLVKFAIRVGLVSPQA
jgi:DNA-binding NarL/FixJ family response regulator